MFQPNTTYRHHSGRRVTIASSTDSSVHFADGGAMQLAVFRTLVRMGVYSQEA